MLGMVVIFRYIWKLFQLHEIPYTHEKTKISRKKKERNCLVPFHSTNLANAQTIPTQKKKLNYRTCSRKSSAVIKISRKTINKIYVIFPKKNYYMENEFSVYGEYFSHTPQQHNQKLKKINSQHQVILHRVATYKITHAGDGVSLMFLGVCVCLSLHIATNIFYMWFWIY